MASGVRAGTQGVLPSDQVPACNQHCARSRTPLAAVGLAATLLFLSTPGYAATDTWNGVGSGCDSGWNTSACWNAGVGPVPATNDDVVIGNSGTSGSPGPTPSNLNNNFTLNSILFNNTGVAVSIGTSSGKSLSLAAGGNITDNNQAVGGDTIAVNLSLLGTGAIILGSGGTGLTLSGVISGSNLLTLTNQSTTGLITLSGVNTYSGGTEITAGTVAISAAANLGTGSLAIDDGAKLEITGTTTYTTATSVTGMGTIIVANGIVANWNGVISDGVSAGTLNVAGPGTLQLSGTNTYTGGTEIHSGTLAISSDANAGTGNIKIDDLATLVLAANGTYAHNLALTGGATVKVGPGVTVTLSGALTDGTSAGNLTLTGGGVISLTGANTYTGSTTVGPSTTLNVASGEIPTASDVTDNGTINFATSSTIGSLAGSGNVTITAVSANTLTVGDATDSTFSGKYTGATNGLFKTGTDTLTLSGANTYGGGTEISQGAISISSDANLGAVSGVVKIDDGTTLKVTGAGSYAHELDLTGTGTVNVALTGPAVVWNGVIKDGASAGTLNVAGTGSLELTQTETYTGGTTISGGTLIVGDGTTNGMISGAVTDNASLQFYRTDAVTFSPLISGTGQLFQNGGATGILTLPGTDTYGGLTTVMSGTLNVMGDITSSIGVLVQAGGTLSGGGFVPQTTIANHGTLAPGIPGTELHVQGGATFNTTSIYYDQLTTTQQLQLNVSGTATLAGTITLKPTGNFAVDQQMVVLTAGALSGQFAGVSTVGSFTDSTASHNDLFPIVSYDGTHVYVTADAASLTPYLPAAANRNERNVAKAIDFAMANYKQVAVPLFAPIADPAAAAQFLSTLDTFTGEVGASAQESIHATMDDFMGELDSAGGLGGPTRTTALASRNGFAQLAYNGPASSMPVGRRPPSRPYEFWGSVHGASNNSDADSKLGTHSTRADDVGGTLGFDLRATSGRAVIGIALSYDDVGWTLAKTLGKGDAKAYQAGFYGSFLFGHTYLSVDAAFGGYDAKTFRALTFGGPTSYRAAFSASDEELRMEIGERYFSNAGTFSPYFNTRLGSLSTPAYAESNFGGSPNFALTYAKEAHTDVTSEFGVAYDSLSGLDVPDSFGIHAKLGWQHDFTAGMSDTATFEAFPGASFTVHGASAPNDAAHGVVGLEDNLGNVALTLDFNSLIGMKSRSIGGDTGILFRW